MRETAYAKINLALHVRGKRGGGYHELETLFAFLDCGDRLTAKAASTDNLKIFGEFAPQLGGGIGNIVSQALAALPRANGLDVNLEKNLPVAAGLGGGSADAGAVFRVVRELHGLPDDWAKRAAKLGADVPACVESVTCIGRGIGSDLEPAPNDLTGTHVLLVNPRVPLSTSEVFAGWDGVDRGPMGMGTGAACDIAIGGRNDLEPAAIAMRPIIAEVLRMLAETEGWLTRMSGSGATCYALYDDGGTATRAAEIISRAHPDWWQMQGTLR